MDNYYYGKGGGSGKKEKLTEQEKQEIQTKKNVDKAVDFINQRIYQLKEQEVENRHMRKRDPFASNDTTAGADYQNQENDLVIFHTKDKFDTFISELQAFLNYLLVKTQKYFVPSIICNSPRDLTKEVLIVLRNSDYLENYQIKHIKSNNLGENYFVQSFSFTDNNPLNWKDQMMNELKNLYLNEGLEIIGGFNQVHSFQQSNFTKRQTVNFDGRLSDIGENQYFEFVYYRQPTYKKNKKFNFFIEIQFEQMNKNEFQAYLNKVKMEQSGIYRTCITVYENSKIQQQQQRETSKSIKSEKQKPKFEVFCHIFIFERRFDDESRFYRIINPPNHKQSYDLSQDLMDFLCEEENKNLNRIAGIVPNFKYQEQMLIFVSNDCELGMIEEDNNKEEEEENNNNKNN